MKKKTLISTILFVILLAAIVLTAFAHSGRTDSAGGHRDNNNVSGLGYYHYHCGGYPAHLHTNGRCPYKSGGSSSGSYSSTKKVKAYDEGYDEGYSDGVDKGYDNGYEIGFKSGKSEGITSTREVYEVKLEEQEAKYKNTVIAFSSAIGVMFVSFIAYIIRKRKKEDE